MDLDNTLDRLTDVRLSCAHCDDQTTHRQYDNGRQRLYLCTDCAMVTTSAARSRDRGD